MIDDLPELWESCAEPFAPRAFDSNSKLAADWTPRVCIVSFRMMSVLFSDLASRPWQMVIVDESHTIHTSIAGV